MVTFDQIVRPALAALEGETPRDTVQLTAVCESSLNKLPGRMEFQRGRLGNRPDGSLCVLSTGNQDSHVLTSLSHADCLIALPIESTGARPGDTVTVVPLDPAWGLASASPL